MSVRLPPLFLAPRLQYTPHTLRLKHLDLTHRLFHASRSDAAELPDHYTTLSIPPTATGPDIKRSFYALSKTHHPDRTRSLPAAEAEAHRDKYLAIADAYGVLGDPVKREQYDRTRTPRHSNSASGSADDAAGFAGGRRASGLSRRRSAFRGPPPSFYRSGGWGTGERARTRREHSEGAESGGGHTHAGRASQQQHQSGDAEDWPFSADPNDVRHFDRGAHYRTTVSVEEQLRQGRAKRRHMLFGMAEGDVPGARRRQQGGIDDDNAIFPEEIGPVREFRNFALIGTVLLVGLGLPWIVWGGMNSAGTSKRRKE